MRHKFLSIWQVVTVLSCLCIASPIQAQLQSMNRMKTQMGAESEQKALEVSPTGDIFYGINANSQSLLKPDNTYNDVIHPEGTTNRAATLLKINADGSFAWGVQAFGSAQKNSQLTGIYYAPDGYLYVTGGVTTTVGTESPVKVFGTTASSLGYMDYFVTKVDVNSGTPVWVRTMGSAADWDLPNAVIADVEGNSYMFHQDFASSFKITTADGLEQTLSPTGGSGNDNLVVKLDNMGFPEWGVTIGSIHIEKFGSLTLSASGDPMVGTVLNSNSATAAHKDLTALSEAERTVTIGGKSYVLNAEKSTDVVITKLSKLDGSVVWSYFWGGEGNQLLTKIAPGFNNGCIILGTNVNRNILAYIDNTGSKIWEIEIASGATMKSVSTDDAGNIYVSGNYSNQVSFGGLSFQTTGAQDAFIAKYSKDGAFLFADHTIGAAGEAINHLALKGDYLAYAGVITGNFTPPFVGNIDPYLRTVNATNHDYVCASYKLTPGFVGSTEISGKKLVSLSFKVGVAFIPNPIFTITSGKLPVGLSLDPETGIIDGSPLVDGDGTFTVKVQSATEPGISLEKVHSYNIERKPCETLSISPTQLEGPFKMGFFAPTTLSLNNADGEINWRAEQLPDNLTLNAKTGVLSGTLTKAGSYTFTVYASDESECEVSITYNIEVAEHNHLAAPSLQWYTAVEGVSFDHCKSNATDQDQNVYVAATYTSLAFDERISFPSSGNPDAMMAKINGSTGKALWAKRVGGEGTGNEQGQAVAVNKQTGETVWVGIGTANATLGDLSQSTPLITNGARDAFIVKHKADGTLAWAKMFGSPADWEAGVNTIFDNSGNIYVAGYKYTQPMTIEGVGGSTITLPGNEKGMFILKLNANGEALWAQLILTHTEIYGLVVDEQNNLYTSGMINGTADFGSGISKSSSGISTFLAKYSENGTCLWVSTVGSAGSVAPSRGHNVARDSQGNLYVATLSKGTVEFGSSTFSSQGGTDAVVYKFNAAGEPLSFISIGSAKDDGGISVKVDAANNLYATGYYAGTINFGNGIYLPLPSGANISTFAAKYSSAGEYLWSFSAGNSLSTGIMYTGLAISIEPTTNDIILSGNSNNNKLFAHAYTGTSEYATGAYFIARYQQKMGLYATLPKGEIGKEFSTTIKVSGCQYPNNISFSLSAGTLQNGLSFDPTTGTISGTPLVGGKKSITITASDGSNLAEKVFEIDIAGPANCDLSIDPIVSTPPCENGKPFTMNVYASLGTGDVSWSFEDPTQVPKGLSLQRKDEETAILSGTPNTPTGEYTFTLVATDEAGCFATANLTLTVTGIYTGIDKIAAENAQIQVYPTVVSNGVLYIASTQENLGETTLTLLDVSGKVLDRQTVYLGDKSVLPYAVDKLNRGFYMITFDKKAQAKESYKFIIK